MRESYVDIVKGWAIITIVFFHCSFMGNGTLSHILNNMFGNQWNVPIFFILCGFFIREQELGKPRTFIKHKLKTLYLPTTLIYLAMVAMHNLFVYIGWYPPGGTHPGNGTPFALYGAKEFFTQSIKVLFCAGSGELAMGAMWFLYVLIYALTGMSLIMWVIEKSTADKKKRLWIFGCTVLALAAASSIGSRFFNFTISRASTALTAMLLIFTGWVMNNALKLKYNNAGLLAASILLLAYCILTNHIHTTLALNRYESLLSLTMGSIAGLYICAYIAKRITQTAIGKALAHTGRNSYYIMALHIVGFFIGNSLLELAGTYTAASPKGMYTYHADGNIAIITLYMLCGIGFPLLFCAAMQCVQKRLPHKHYR